VKRLIAAVFVLAASVLGPSGLAATEAGPGPDSALQVPEIAAAVPVTLDARSTALLVLDMNELTCTPRPRCVATVPQVAALLGKARAAGVAVIYSQTPGGSNVLAPLAPLGGEPLVTSRADKFFGTDLDEVLTAAGAETLVIVGVAANGAPLYTSFGANLRGYTVVVAEDGIAAGNEFDEFLTRYQLLNQPGFENPSNTPAMAGRVTLSRTNLITFR